MQQMQEENRIEELNLLFLKTNFEQSFKARSSSGLGRRPLKAEITGSNPVRATKGKYFNFPFCFL